MWGKLAGSWRTVKSVDEMQALAREVVVELEPGGVLLLCGPLGSGKTVFVQSLARALGVADKITSPTFTVVAEYDTRGRSAIERVVHIDLYRLSDKEAGNELSVLQALEEDRRNNAVTLIEWAEKLGDNALKGSKRVEFEYGVSENERKVRFVD